MNKHNRRNMIDWTDDEWDLVATRVSELKESNPDSNFWVLTNAAQAQVLPLNRHNAIMPSHDHSRLAPLYKRLGLDEKGNVPPPPPPPPPPAPPEPPAVVAQPATVETKNQAATGITEVEVKTWIKEHGTAGFLLEEVAGGFARILEEIKAGRAEIAGCRKEFSAHVTDVNLEVGKLRQECEDAISSHARLVDKAAADMAVIQEMTLASIEDWEKIIINMSTQFQGIMASIGEHISKLPGFAGLSEALIETGTNHLLDTTQYGPYVITKAGVAYEKIAYPNYVEPPITVAVVGPREVDFRHIQEKVKPIGVTVHLLSADEAIRIPKDVTAVFVSTRFAHKKLSEVRDKFRQHIVPVNGGVSSMVGEIGKFAKEVISTRRVKQTDSGKNNGHKTS